MSNNLDTDQELDQTISRMIIENRNEQGVVDALGQTDLHLDIKQLIIAKLKEEVQSAMLRQRAYDERQLKQAEVEALERVLELPDMQIEIPYTRSKTSARHTRNKLRTKRLIPEIQQLLSQLKREN